MLSLMCRRCRFDVQALSLSRDGRYETGVLELNPLDARKFLLFSLIQNTYLYGAKPNRALLPRRPELSRLWPIYYRGVKKMNSMLKAVALLGLAAFGIPALSAQQAGSEQSAQPARPGTVNYIEGSASVDGTPLNPHDVGSLDLDAGQVLSTAQGRAEMLLTPGVYLRLDHNSAVKMISPDIAQTQIEVVKGKAGVEVDEIFKQNNIEVVVDNVSTKLLQDGYYEFNASAGTAMVFRGKAEVELGDGRTREIKNHHEFTLTELNDGGRPLNKEKAVSFDASGANDTLYNWSSLRSEYQAEANNQIAGDYYGAGYYPGWYWDPYAWDYTFIGLDPFFSPFGWGFYPFGWYGWGGYPGWGGWYGGRGWYGGHPIHTPVRGNPGIARGFAGGGIHGGGFHGGGFAGGGFHGGGFGGGGFHGGGGFGGGGRR